MADKIADRVLCVIGAVLFSQAPEFMQQYLQRLGGSLDEARRIVGKYVEVAHDSGFTLDAYIAHASATPDAALAKLGGVMEGAVTRMNDLFAAQSALQNASGFTRPFVFLVHADAQVAHGAWAIFKPAVPVTVEGVFYALIGLLVFYGLYRLCIRRPMTFFRNKWRARKAQRRPAAEHAQGT